MAITKVLTNTFLDSATGGNLTVNMPGSLLSTDIAVLGVGLGRSGGTSGNYNTPTGWSLVGQVLDANTGSNHITGQVYVSVGTPAGLTFTLSGVADTKGYMCAAFRGVSNVTPIDAIGTVNSNTGANSLVSNLVTVVTDQSWHLICAFDWLGGNLTNASFVAAQNGNTNETACVLYNTTPKSTGSTGTVTVSSSAGTSGQVIIAIPFALRPAVSATKAYSSLRRGRRWFRTMGGVLAPMTTGILLPAGVA